MMDIKYPVLALKTYDAGVMKSGVFTLKKDEGKLPGTFTPSPFYLSFRYPPKGPLTDKLVEEYGEALQHLIHEACILYTSVAGVPQAGEPFASVIARYADVPLIFLGKEERAEGRRITIDPEFRFTTGMEDVLLVDDLITEAHSKLEAIAAIRSAGGDVRHLVVLVDREQGGCEALKHAGVNVLVLWRISKLLDFYVAEGRLSPGKRDEVMKYLRA